MKAITPCKEALTNRSHKTSSQKATNKAAHTARATGGSTTNAQRRVGRDTDAQQKASKKQHNTNNGVHAMRGTQLKRHKRSLPQVQVARRLLSFNVPKHVPLLGLLGQCLMSSACAWRLSRLRPLINRSSAAASVLPALAARSTTRGLTQAGAIGLLSSTFIR